MSSQLRTVGVLITATGNYMDFFDQCYRSMEACFLTRARKQYYLFTEHECPLPGNVVRVPAQRLGYPGDALKAYDRAWSIRDLIHQHAIDVLYYIDVDMRVVGEIGEEFVPTTAAPLVGVIHPGFHWVPSGGTPERNPRSTAYIDPAGRYPWYICSGIYGGLTADFLSAAATIREWIDQDDENGVVTIWADESYWNRYLASYPDKFQLHPPEYCYPEGALSDPGLRQSNRLDGYTPKILALDKDHAAVRGEKTLRRRVARMLRRIRGGG